MMKSLIRNTLGVIAICFIGFGSAQASEEGATPHYPIEHPKHVHWSFAGPFGHWDLAQLQRGFKIYHEVCSACHAMKLVAYRNLQELGFSEAQVKAYIAENEIEVDAEPNEDGEVEKRAAKPSDLFVPPFENDEAAKANNNGALPPDFSLLAKARAPERGFPNFVFDVFTMYAENGPDYIYSLLTGYQEAPAGVKVEDGTHYNPYFIAGPALAMAAPLSDGQVTYDDGSPETLDQYSKDISAFMMWAAEPKLVERKSLGFKVMIFLLVFAGLMYFTKKKIWSDVKH